MYPNNTVCEWEISVPHDTRIHFRFAELDIENRDCQVNYLRLYDGIGRKRRVIGECFLTALFEDEKRNQEIFILCLLWIQHWLKLS